MKTLLNASSLIVMKLPINISSSQIFTRTSISKASVILLSKLKNIFCCSKHVFMCVREVNQVKKILLHTYLVT